jgi:type IV secretory pathway VirB9-like protein
MKWLRNEGLMQEVIRDDGRKTNHPTEKGQRLGINIVLERNLDGLEYQRVLYSVAAQRFILSNIESIASFINSD